MKLPAFINDYYNPPDYRNLYVDKESITVLGDNLPPDVEVEIEAEDMSIQTTGAPTSGGWNIYANGYIADNLDFAAGGTVSFEVIARGSYAGELADNGSSDRPDSSGNGYGVLLSWATYTVQASITAGTHEVAIAFINDFYNQPDDRNLYVDKVTLR